jgi:hypothetical protein
MGRPIKPLALQHPADDPRVRDLILRFYENCVDYQSSTIDAETMISRRADIVLDMMCIQPSR